MTSVQGKGCLVQSDWASEALTSFLFYRLDRSYHKDLLVSNKPRLFKALTPEIPAFEAFVLLFKAPKLDVAW